MNRQQFISYIEKSDLLNKKDLPVLMDLAKEFPFCQTSHLLLAKTLYNEKSIHYNQQLKLAAAYATDRKALYKLIMQAPASEIISQAVSTMPVNDEILLNVLKTEELPEPPIAALKPELSEVPAAPPESARLSLTSDSAEAKQNAIQKRLNEIAAKKSLQKQELQEASNSVDAPTTPENPESVRDAIKPPVTIPAAKTIDTVELEIVKDIVDLVLLQSLQAPEKKNESLPASNSTESPAPEIPVAVKNEKLSFTSWIKEIQGNEKQPLYEAFGELPEKEALPENPDKAQNNSLIDKFIATEPRIVPNKAEFFSPVNIARVSVIDTDEVVTETLAKIYVKQGNIMKAIKIYEKLTLKYPEKRIYFATQIDLLHKNK